MHDGCHSPGILFRHSDFGHSSFIRGFEFCHSSFQVNRPPGKHKFGSASSSCLKVYSTKLGFSREVFARCSGYRGAGLSLDGVSMKNLIRNVPVALAAAAVFAAPILFAGPPGPPKGPPGPPPPPPPPATKPSVPPTTLPVLPPPTTKPTTPPKTLPLPPTTLPTTKPTTLPTTKPITPTPTKPTTCPATIKPTTVPFENPFGVDDGPPHAPLPETIGG